MSGNWPTWYLIFAIFLVIIMFITIFIRDTKAEKKEKKTKNKIEDEKILNTQKEDVKSRNNEADEFNFDDYSDLVDMSSTISEWKNDYIARSTKGLKSGIQELELLLSNQTISTTALLKFKNKKFSILDELFCLNLSLIDREVFRQFGHEMRVEILDDEYFGKAMGEYLIKTNQVNRDDMEFMDFVENRFEYWGSFPFPGGPENNLIFNFSRFIAQIVDDKNALELHLSFLNRFFYEYYNKWLLESIL
ncbi:MAG: hypothetical protein DAHOPDDO_00062 [Ignavibacteriaceae bacterium]|nr:hypothetical protein [Ignavibacteriaceae bacterium]